MKIILYVESVKMLDDFLEKKSEAMLWSHVPYLDFVQVILNSEEYALLIKESEPKVEEEIVEVEAEEAVSFWNMPEDELQEFNKRGLFSLEQLKSSFAAGTEYVLNLKLELEEEVHKKPKTFVEWYEDTFKK